LYHFYILNKKKNYLLILLFFLSPQIPQTQSNLYTYPLHLFITFFFSFSLLNLLFSSLLSFFLFLPEPSFLFITFFFLLCWTSSTHFSTHFDHVRYAKTHQNLETYNIQRIPCHHIVDAQRILQLIMDLEVRLKTRNLWSENKKLAKENISSENIYGGPGGGPLLVFLKM
jgi:hypothetical protein